MPSLGGHRSHLKIFPLRSYTRRQLRGKLFVHCPDHSQRPSEMLILEELTITKGVPRALKVGPNRKPGGTPCDVTWKDGVRV